MIPEVQLLKGLQETVEFMELPVQLGLIKHDRSEELPLAEGDASCRGGKSQSAGPGRTFATLFRALEHVGGLLLMLGPHW